MTKEKIKKLLKILNNVKTYKELDEITGEVMQLASDYEVDNCLYDRGTADLLLQDIVNNYGISALSMITHDGSYNLDYYYIEDGYNIKCVEEKHLVSILEEIKNKI